MESVLWARCLHGSAGEEASVLRTGYTGTYITINYSSLPGFFLIRNKETALNAPMGILSG